MHARRINNQAKFILLAPSKDPAKKLEQLLEFKQHLEPNAINDLDRALEMLIEDAEGYRLRLSK